MTAYQLDDALTELELLADQLERVEPDLTRHRGAAVRVDTTLLTARLGNIGRAS